MEAERGASALTVSTYRESLTDFMAYLQREDATLTPEAADADLVRGWVENLMDRGMKATTVNKKLSAVKSFYRYALAHGVITRDPANAVRGPKRQKTLPTFLREGEVNVLFDGMEWDMDDLRDVREHTLLLLLYVTGMRRAEVIALTDSDVDTVQRVVRVTGKRRKQRIIPIADEMVNELERYRRMRDEQTPAADASGAFFRNDKGLQLTAPQVYRAVHDRLSLVTTQKKRSPHVMRHTFATAMLNGGAGMVSVQKLLGHKSLDTTQIYTHVTFDELKRSYDAAHPRGHEE